MNGVKSIHHDVQRKMGRNWETTFSENDPYKSTRRLLDELYSKYVFKDAYYKQVKRIPHFDGTATIIVYLENDLRVVYEVRE